MSSAPDPNMIGPIRKTLALTLDLKFQELMGDDSPAARHALIEHWHLWQENHKQQLLAADLKLTPAIRQAMYAADLQTKSNAFDAAAELVDFELMGDLVEVTTQPNYVHRETSGQLLSHLAVQLFESQQMVRQVVGKAPKNVDEETRFRWPANRAHLREQLERAVQCYSQHRRAEILLAYLLFTDYSDPFVKRALALETHEAHGDLMALLFQSRTHPVIEKLAGFVAVRKPPVKLIRLWQDRDDWPFVMAFLEEAGTGQEEIVAANVKMMDKPRWLETAFQRFAELKENQQTALLRLMVHAIDHQETRLEWLMRLLSLAAPPVRRATVGQICRIPGARATKVVSYLVEQEQDAQCLVILLPELRKRNIKGALKRLLTFLDHSDPAVRQAAGESFQDCNIQRYLAAFDMLNETVRASTGQLVGKVDPATDRVLKAELQSTARSRRLRAMIAIRSIGNAIAMQESLWRALTDHDYRIREAAANTLALCPNRETQNQLRRVLMDEHPKVRKAAELSLQILAGEHPSRNTES